MEDQLATLIYEYLSSYIKDTHSFGLKILNIQSSSDTSMLFMVELTSFKVNVPVLSLQIVVAEPMVSHAESRRTCISVSVR